MKRGAALGGIAVALATPIRQRFEPSETDRFAAWRGGPARNPVAAMEGYFAREKVGDVLPLPRSELIVNLCALHARTGPHSAVGLGIDRSHALSCYWRWGDDYRAASSPCRTLR